MSHIHDKIDFSADVFIVCENKVLLRKHDKYHKWFAVGGHIELDEDPNEAAIREVKEEVGLDVVLDSSHQPFKFKKEGYEELIPPRFMNRHTINDGHEHVANVYFATSQSMDVVPEGDDRSDAWHWFTKEELEANEEGIEEEKIYYGLEALRILGK